MLWNASSPLLDCYSIALLLDIRIFKVTINRVLGTMLSTTKRNFNTLSDQRI